MTLPEIQQQGREAFVNQDGDVLAFLDTYAATVWNAALAAVEEKIKEVEESYLVQKVYPSDSEIIKASYSSRQTTIKAVIDSLTSLKSPEAALELAGEE